MQNSLQVDVELACGIEAKVRRHGSSIGKSEFHFESFSGSKLPIRSNLETAVACQQIARWRFCDEVGIAIEGKVERARSGFENALIEVDPGLFEVG